MSISKSRSTDVFYLGSCDSNSHCFITKHQVYDEKTTFLSSGNDKIQDMYILCKGCTEYLTLNSYYFNGNTTSLYVEVLCAMLQCIKTSYLGEIDAFVET